MRNRTMTILGVSVIILGSIILINNITGINLWVYVWPLLIIALGVLMVARPRHFTARSFRLIGEIEREGAWTVQPEEINSLIADMDLDMTRALIPEGNTPVRIRGLIGDIQIRIPADVGVKINAQAIVVDANVFGYNQDYFLTPYDYQSENFNTATRTLTFEISHFIASLKVRRG